MSKKRVSDFGEVYTAKKQIEILARKREAISRMPAPLSIVERDTLRAVASVYGVDIQKDNVLDIANEEKQKATEAAAMGAMADPGADRIVALKELVISQIRFIDDRFSPSTIEKVFDKVIVSKAGKENIENDSKVAQLVMKKLNEMGKTDKRKSGSKTKAANQAIVAYLNDDSNMKTEDDRHES